MKGNEHRSDSLEIACEAMFDKSIQLSETERRMLAIVRDTYAMWLDKPTSSDQAILQYLQTTHGLSREQAYRYLYVIKINLAHVPHAAKEWYRYKANHILDEAYEAATKDKDDKKAKSLYKIAEALVKVNNLDKEEGEQFPFDKIVPPEHGFTTDPSVLGIKPIPNVREKAEHLMKKYADELEEIQDGYYGPADDGTNTEEDG
jgi:hypothetical protein